MWAYHYPGLEPIEERQPHWELQLPIQTMRKLYPQLRAWPFEIFSIDRYLRNRDEVAKRHGIQAFLHMWYFSQKAPIWGETVEFICRQQTVHIPVGIVWCWKMPHESQMQSCVPHDITPRCAIREAVGTRQQLIEGVDYLLSHYFRSPNYLRIDGRPILLFYHLEGWNAICSTFGSPFAIVKDACRKQAIDPYLVGISTSKANVWNAELLQGLDAVARYNDLPDFQGPKHQEFRLRTRSYMSYWKTDSVVLSKYNISFIPSVSVGWNATMRHSNAEADGNLEEGYPLSPIVSCPILEDIFWALQRAKDCREQINLTHFTLCAWNEWTENAAIEYFLNECNPVCKLA